MPPREYTIITPERFGQLYRVLPTADAQLPAEAAIDSGMRWGGLTELRVEDLHRPGCIVTVRRVYTLGKCKCDDCRGAYSRYRAERRATGNGDPRQKRLRDTEIPRDWWREQVWNPGLEKAELARRRGSGRCSTLPRGSSVGADQVGSVSLLIEA